MSGEAYVFVTPIVTGWQIECHIYCSLRICISKKNKTLSHTLIRVACEKRRNLLRKYNDIQTYTREFVPREIYVKCVGRIQSEAYTKRCAYFIYTHAHNIVNMFLFQTPAC